MDFARRKVYYAYHRICGASGSGKTTLAHALAGQIKGRCVLINQDAYYRDHPHLSFAERERLNYDEPAIFEHDQLLADVTASQQGLSFPRKAYDFTNHRRADTNEPVRPAIAYHRRNSHLLRPAPAGKNGF